jgi:hypothetical protein
MIQVKCSVAVPFCVDLVPPVDVNLYASFFTFFLGSLEIVNVKCMVDPVLPFCPPAVNKTSAKSCSSALEKMASRVSAQIGHVLSVGWVATNQPCNLITFLPSIGVGARVCWNLEANA